jgi:hypothetical protein
MAPVKLEDYKRPRAHPLAEKPEKPPKMPKRIGDVNDGPDSLRSPGTVIGLIIFLALGAGAIWWIWNSFVAPQ